MSVFPNKSAHSDTPAPDASEPVPPHPAPAGAADGPRCRCGKGENPDRPGFCTNSHPLPRGAALARQHGVYATPTADMQVFEAAGRALAEQSIADAGGRDELSARELPFDYRAEESGEHSERPGRA